MQPWSFQYLKMESVPRGPQSSVLEAILLTFWITCLLGSSAHFWAMCCLMLRSCGCSRTVASFPLKASRSGGLWFWHLIWTALSLIFSGSREVCAEKLIYSLVKGHMWGPTTNYTGIKQHWEFAGWPTLVFRCFCVIYFASVYVIMMLDCSGCAQYTKTS